MQIDDLDDRHGPNEEDENLGGLAEVVQKGAAEAVLGLVVRRVEVDFTKVLPGVAGQREEFAVGIHHVQQSVVETDAEQRPANGTHQEGGDGFV